MGTMANIETDTSRIGKIKLFFSDAISGRASYFLITKQ